MLQSGYISYTIYRQCSYDIILVDWERSKQRHQQVSAWRSILIAKEWNNLQSRRKTAIEFTLAWIIFFFIGRALYQNALSSPNLEKSSSGYINIVLRFANTVWWWVSLSVAQWVWKIIFYERYFSEPPSQSFLDLCTMANISILVMDARHHGYYLHGRSPFEFSDCNMAEMIEQMKKEENGFLTVRGLDAPGAPRECQSFEIHTTNDFINALHKVRFNEQRK